MGKTGDDAADMRVRPVWSEDGGRGRGGGAAGVAGVPPSGVALTPLGSVAESLKAGVVEVVAEEGVPVEVRPRLCELEKEARTESGGRVSPGEEKSVYVGNVPASLTEADLEQEFKDFGRLKHDGVAIRSRKDSGGYYAFVEFEDVIGASPLIIKGWQIYVEERRPNSSMPRGGRRGRGRGGYGSEAPRGCFGGRSYGRSSAQDSDREYNSRRANGVQRVPRQERGILGNHVSRNGQYSSNI